MHSINTQKQKTKVIKPINNNGSISIQFQLNGKTYKFNPVKGGQFDDPIALGKAKTIAEQITRDIQLDEFDLTLTKYKPKLHLTVVEKPIDEIKTVVELWLKYFEFKRSGIKAKTVEKYENFASLFYKLGDLSPLCALEIKKKLEQITTLDRTRDALMYLSACCKWAVKHKLIAHNPYEGMYQELPKPNYAQNPAPNAFTKEEKELIIERFRTDERSGLNYRCYTDFVEFLFLVGCRPSEAVGLTWDDINEDCSLVHFNKAIIQVRSRITHSEKSKNNKIRTIAVSKRTTDLLLKIKPEVITPKQLIFHSPIGLDKAINYQNFSRRAWGSIVDPIKPETTPYCCRDTFITSQLVNGVPSSVIAKWCDTSTAMIDKYYADKLKLSQLRPMDD